MAQYVYSTDLGEGRVKMGFCPHTVTSPDELTLSYGMCADCRAELPAKRAVQQARFETVARKLGVSVALVRAVWEQDELPGIDDPRDIRRVEQALGL